MSIINNLTVLPTFETERLLLRQITDSKQDGLDCLEFINDYRVYRTWGMYDENNKEMPKPEPMTSYKEHYQNTMRDFMNKDELTWLIVKKDTNKVIGEVLLYDFQLDVQAEIGYRIHHDEWGKGFAFEAAQAIVNYAFTGLDLKRIQLKCFHNNIGSRRVAEKLGFREEGFIREGVILEVVTDFHIYGLLQKEYLAKEGHTNEQ